MIGPAWAPFARQPRAQGKLVYGVVVLNSTTAKARHFNAVLGRIALVHFLADDLLKPSRRSSLLASKAAVNYGGKDTL